MDKDETPIAPAISLFPMPLSIIEAIREGGDESIFRGLCEMWPHFVGLTNTEIKEMLVPQGRPVLYLAVTLVKCLVGKLAFVSQAAPPAHKMWQQRNDFRLVGFVKRFLQKRTNVISDIKLLTMVQERHAEFATYRRFARIFYDAISVYLPRKPVKRFGIVAPNSYWLAIELAATHEWAVRRASGMSEEEAVPSNCTRGYDPRDASFITADNLRKVCAATIKTLDTEELQELLVELDNERAIAEEQAAGKPPSGPITVAEERAEELRAKHPSLQDEPEPTGMSRQEVAKRLECLCERGETFTSQGKLAKTLGCSSGTVNKAIQNNPKLRQWAQRPGAVPKAQSLNPVVTDATPSSREPDPADEAAIREYLEGDRTPDERAFFNGLSREDQLAFLDDPDAHDLDEPVRILGRKP